MEIGSGSDAISLLQPKPFKKLSRLAKRPPVDIEFQDLTYGVREGGIKPVWKHILKAVHGNFRSGELTAILGPSGAGKTTLLNILAGYISTSVTGSIKINGKPRLMKLFHKLSSYIMQEDLIQECLTVEESMLIAAQLKLGPDIGLEAKHEIVLEVLEILGLQDTLTTRTERLSGGQRKRFCIALELVNNPPVIFLDEPTTGLDTVAIKQCVNLLHTLSRQARTVICTIHQPSDSIFLQFDQVYFMADGFCVYNGSPKNLVPYMLQASLPCPTTYSPADYIIEVSQESSENVSNLALLINNGKNNHTNIHNATESVKMGLHRGETISYIYGETSQPDGAVGMTFPTSFSTQFRVLLRRMFLQMWRNTTSLWIQLIHHVLCALLIGALYFGVGEDAFQMFANFRFCLVMAVFFVYTHLMAPILIFPTEVKLLEREYFNRWYGLKAYYMALTARNAPVLILLGLVFLVISYVLSSQPMDLKRFLEFALICIMIGEASQALGIAIGAVFNVTNGCAIGPTIVAPMLAIAIHGMGYGIITIHPVMKFLMSISYLRYGIVGICSAIYEDRPPLDCADDLYCHYRDPKMLLRDVGMQDSPYYVQILGLFFFTILYRIIAFMALRYRLTSELSKKVVIYATKILRHK